MKRYLPLIFAFFPILNIYETGIISALSIGQILLLFSFVACRNNTFRLHFPAFVVYGTLITIICIVKPGVSIAESVYELLAFLIFFILYSFVIKAVDYFKFLKSIKILGYVSLSFFYLQYILKLIGIHIVGIIPGLPLSNGAISSDFYQSRLYADRISSIFQEPAHFAEFMSMFLAIILYKFGNSRKKLVLAIAISLSVILCRSAGGYVLLLVCWLCWGWDFLKGKKNKIKYLFPAVIIICLMLPVILQNEMIGSVLTRYQTLSFSPENSEYGYSSYTRLFRGYIPFIESTLFEKIFGHGIGTLLSFVRMNPNSMFLAITDYDANWINSFQFILFSTGVIGAILFFKYLYMLYRTASPLGKTLVIIYILALLSSGILLTPSSMLLLYVIYCECKTRFNVNVNGLNNDCSSIKYKYNDINNYSNL